MENSKKMGNKRLEKGTKIKKNNCVKKIKWVKAKLIIL